ncbi:flagellar hook-length control protein FliK [uncultured Methylophaga sp.]|uniref:flagellar hook-length control protein FliK n=1 Tax=uncultured Methylophaga sp. TaxID=285271 RepID=UPI00260344D1|nr:flagellar hook-length control protein FliK [uncultured Methylophaga sp.]
MQINSSAQAQAEVVREVPARLLASLSQGRPVEATVLSRPSADSVRLQVGDTVVQLNSRLALQPGQQVQLERAVENGRPVVRISTEALDKALPPLLLRQGQQVAVEVVKLLAENRLLVTPRLLNSNQPAAAGRLPAQIEVDIRALQQTFTPGQRLALEVLREQPLSVGLRTDSPSRAELIQRYQRALLPQFTQVATQPLQSLNQLASSTPVAAPVRQAASQLLQALADSSSLQRADGLRQALGNSGLFLENNLRNANPAPAAQDLKANLLQLAQVLKTELVQSGSARLLDNPALLQKMPAEVQTALRQLVSTPQQLSQLPAQVPPALASRGQTPMQLLLSLLAGLSSGQQSTPGQNSAATPSQGLTHPQLIAASREQPAAQNQPAIRAMEWQLMRDLLREVESATARIQYNQLSMLREADTTANNNIWLFDLPVKDKQQLQMLQMRLEQHSAALTDDEDAIWQVQLNLETRNLGPMQARISLHQQDVKVVLLAEREHSAAMLSSHIDDLNRRLQKLDINVSHLSCRQAPVKPLTAEADLVKAQHLLDISV